MNMLRVVPVASLLVASSIAQNKSAWTALPPADRGTVTQFAEDYKAYLNVARGALFDIAEPAVANVVPIRG